MEERLCQSNYLQTSTSYELRMELFRPRLIWSLPEALAASKCRRLLIWVDEEFQSSGPQLLQLTHLQELSLQGEYTIFDYPNFILPVEIGQLQTLRKLTLLNLPITPPEWITQLSELRDLTVRGTDLVHIPNWISQLQRLYTLHIGNCKLQDLPETLRQMNNLRHLTFADIQLRELRPEQFPRHLKSLVFSGSYKRRELHCTLPPCRRPVDSREKLYFHYLTTEK